MKENEGGKRLDEEPGLGWGGGDGGQKQRSGGGWQRVGVNSHSSSLHGVEMILLTPEL